MMMIPGSLPTPLCLAAIMLSVIGLSAKETARVEPDAAAAIGKVYPALVRISVVMEQGAEGRMKKMQGTGSGTIISEDGLVLTNHHVAGRGTRFVCTLSNREEVDATLVGTDALSDLAVLKLDLETRRFKDQPLAVARFGDSDKLKTGDVVFAMGSPGGLSQSVTRGIVANTEMIVPRHQIGLTLDGEKVGELVRWIGHDAVIYPGNSGGPLVSPEGEIIGVNEVGIASLGGAIPSNLAKKVAEELRAKGHVTRGWIGVEIQPLLRGMADKKGALVSTVWKESPAANAGIQPGDFITGYQGRRVPDCHAAEDLPLFNAMVLDTAPGTEVSIEGERDGKPMTWKATTVPREATQAKESELREWGITTRDFTRMSALEMFLGNEEGVIVDTVRTGGPSLASKPPLRKGDVITKADGKAIRSRTDLDTVTAAFIKGLEEPEPMLVEFERDGLHFATVVKLGTAEEPLKPMLAEKAWMGVATQVLTDDLAAAYGIPGKKGVRVIGLSPDSPGEKAGIVEGDILLKLDDRVINARRPEDAEVLSELIFSYPVDATVVLAGLRDGVEKTWEVTLAPRPVADSELLEHNDELFEFTAREISTAQRERSKERFGEAISGVSVPKVEPNGWAALGGLSIDDIILSIDGETLLGIDALKKKLQSFRETKPRRVVFQIQRGPRTHFLEIEPKW